MRKLSLWAPLGAVLVMTLACTVGEARPGASGAEGPAPEEPRRDTAVVEPGGAVDSARYANDYLAADVLVRAQRAYEAAELEEAIGLSEQLLSEYPASGSAGTARWVGARAAFALGRYERARELAETYAETRPPGSAEAEQARELARLAEDAMAPPAPEPAVIGAVLPRSGPRVLVRYADWLLEGIQLAIEEAERQQGRRIDLMVADDSGGVGTDAAVRALERGGALAIVGPLLPRQLAAAAAARDNPRRVLISPTAAGTPEWPEAYTLSSSDGRGAQALGRYAGDVGFGQAALLYARDREYELKAQAFAVEFESLGGEVRAMVPYDSGTTTFGPHMDRILEAVAPRDPLGVDRALVDSLITLGIIRDRMAADTMSRERLLRMTGMLAPSDTAMGPEPGAEDPWDGARQRPFALYVAAARQDVPKIAPQVAFYGLDSAGVQVFGDEAWASAEVRRVVPARDLEGVIASSHFPPDRAAATADPEFVALYEGRYRRSLDNPLPALGYDAANLVLQALPNRMLRPDALARRFGFLAGIRGATGQLSVRSGRVVRTPYLVVTRGGELEPAPFPWEYEMPVPVPPKPDSTEGEGSRR
ncbi:MAG: ABC transporter substrate-binding protein [Candidatus Longimicrobiales bacterium M2_2A_002]